MGWGGIHRFGTARPFSSCIAHQFYLVESRRSYISCAGCCISSFSTFKSIEVPFYLPILLTDDNIYPAISENSIVLWNARFLPSAIERAIVCIPATCLSRLSFRPLHVSPPAAPPLSPIPAPFLSSITYRSVYLPSVPTPYRPCRLLGTSVVPLPRRRHRPFRSRSPIAHARVYRLRLPHRSTQPS